MTSCGSDSKSDVTAIPFKADEDGKWGMLSTDGKTLFGGEFRNAPTVVTDGRFFVQNQDGFWEMYAAEETPRRIGGELRYASSFSCGVAMVTPRDGAISIINKEGETVAELTELVGKKVSWASPFTGRNAVVACDTLQGVVDVKGNIVVAPEFSTVDLLENDMIVAQDFAYTQSHAPYDSVAPKGRQIVLDAKGKEVFSVDASKYWGVVNNAVTDKYVVVNQIHRNSKKEKAGNETVTVSDITWSYFILNHKGEEVVKAGEKEKIFALRGEEYIYSNEDNLCGVKTIDGKEIVKPEYNGINFIGQNCYALEKDGDESNDWTATFKLVDAEGKQIGNEMFQGLSGNLKYRAIAGSNIFVKVDADEWTAYEAEGKKLAELPKIADMLPYSYGDAQLRTDLVDFDKFLKALKITPDSMDGYTFTMGPRAALEQQQRQWGYASDQQRPKPSDYSWMQDIYVYGEAEGLPYSGEVHFPDRLSKQTYRENKVIDFTYGNTYWYHMEKVPTGFVFNNINPSMLKLTFNSWTFYGKLRPLYKAIVAYCKKWGTVEDSNNAATLMNLNNGKKLLVVLKDKEVELMWGKLPSEANWIGAYVNNAEKLEPSYTGNVFVATEVNTAYSAGDTDSEEMGDI